MATVDGLTKARMLAIEDASVVSGEMDVNGHLILTTYGGTDIDAGYMLASVPAASETVSGIVELATSAEATAGTDTVRAVTPAGLAAAVGTLVPDASDTVKGKVELATQAEAIAGTSTTLAVTPEGLAATVAAASVPDATETVKGKVELATTGEATTGTDTVRAVTPAGLKAAIDAVLQLIFPVGAIYTSSSVSTSPATLLGFGTWTAINAQMLIGADGGTFTAGTTGGAQTHTLAEANLPAHVHSAGTLDNAAVSDHQHAIGRDSDAQLGSNEYVLHSAGISGAESTVLTGGAGGHDHAISGNTGSVGSGTAVNHMNPWRAVYMWRRTA